jgi:ribosome biogenesis GTPase
VCVLLITVNNPPTTFNFIDRLVTAEAYGIETVLVFNKIDTLDDNFR